MRITNTKSRSWYLQDADGVFKLAKKSPTSKLMEHIKQSHPKLIPAIEEKVQRAATARSADVFAYNTKKTGTDAVDDRRRGKTDDYKRGKTSPSSRERTETGKDENSGSRTRNNDADKNRDENEDRKKPATERRLI